MNQMIAKKIKMTQIFDQDGNVIPVTILEAGPLTVVQKKTKETDGYEAVQVGFQSMKESRANEPMLGHFKKNGVKPFRVLKELRLEKMSEMKPAQELKVNELFKVGEFVDVSAVSKGKGFQGTMKRHNYGGGPASHGSMSHRRPASGGETNNARVYRGKRSPGHMGHEKVTVIGLEIAGVEPDRNLLLIRGAVPGPNGSLVFLRNSIKSALKIKRKETAKAAKLEEVAAKDKGKAKAKK